MAAMISPPETRIAHVFEGRHAPVRRSAADKRRRARPEATARSLSRSINRSPQPCAPKSGFITSGPLAHSRRAMARACASDLRCEGLRRRQSGPRQKKARHGFIGAALDGARAVDTGTPSASRACRIPSRMVIASSDPSPMARTIARSGRSRNPGMMRPWARPVSILQAESRTAMGVAPCARKARSVRITCQSSLSVKTAMRGGGPLSSLRGAMGSDLSSRSNAVTKRPGDHPPNDLSSSARLTSPARKVSPVSTAVTSASAGENRLPSIL